MTATIEVNHHAFGDLGQMAARVFDRRHAALLDEVEIDIVGQIRSIQRVAQLAPQQAAQPAVMVDVQLFELPFGRKRSVVHNTSPETNPPAIRF